MKKTLLILFTSCLFLMGTGATVPQMYVQSAIPGDAGFKLQMVMFDSPFTSTRDAQGRVHLGLTLPITAVDIGGLQGIITVQYANQPPQIFVDSGVVSYRVPVPTGPGACPTKPGTAVFAADATGAWYCVPDATGAFVWMKVAGSVAGW